MSNIDDAGLLGPGYDLGTAADLHSIACRYQGEAWVAGAEGTLLYTNDGGTSWVLQAVPTSATLYSVATQDTGPVYIVGDGVFMTTDDTGAHWNVANSAASFRAVAAAQQADTVLAISDDGGVWSYSNAALVHRAAVAGARGIAVSPDGETSIIAGNGLFRSSDAGATWQPLVVDASLQFDDVRIADDGTAIAVGVAGAIANIDAAGAVSVQHIGAAELHTLHLDDGDSGYAGVGIAAGDGGEVLITWDGGQSWAVGPSLGRTVLGVDSIGFGHR